MSRKLIIILGLLLLGSMACALTQSSVQPTPVVLVATQAPTQSPTPITPTPTPTTAPSTGNTGNPTCTPRSDWATYIVVQGDTLGRLAERTGTTAQQLASANCLSNANVIAVGQPLRVPRQPNTAIPPTATPINAPVPLDLNPAGLPPGNVCAVSNPNPNAPVQVYVESGGGNLSPANIRLVTWAPFVRVMDAWYQIAAPETGGIFVPASQTILAGVTCPLNYQICTFTYPGSGNFLTYSGAGSNYGPGVQLPGNTPLPVLGRSQGWVQVGTDYLHAGWIESAAGTLAGPCN